MIKTKKFLISAIIVGIITIFALIIALAIISILKKDNNNSQNTKVYTFSDNFDFSKETDRLSFQAIYLSTSDYTISSLEEFKNFAKSVCYVYTEEDSLHGESYTNYIRVTNNYKGKTITLNNDIDLSGFSVSQYSAKIHAPLESFAGTFNGNGKQISNFYSSKTSANTALFGILEGGGKVINTKFVNCGAYIPSGGTDTTYGAIIANKVSSGAEINSCIVNGCYFKSGRWKKHVQVAPLAGDNQGTVKNCIVTGEYKIGGEDDKLVLEDEGLHASYFVCATNEAEHCVFIATVTKAWTTSETVAPVDNDKNAFDSQFSNHTSYQSAHNAWKNGSYAACSNIPGSIEEYSQYPWFQYGNGSGVRTALLITKKYLGLRAFIDFTTYVIEVENGTATNSLTNESGNVVRLTVPTEFASVTYTNNGVDGYAIATNYISAEDNSILIQVQTQPKNVYYTLDQWVGSKAVYKMTKVKIQFASVVIGGININGSGIFDAVTYSGDDFITASYDKTTNKLTYSYYQNGSLKTFTYDLSVTVSWTVDKYKIEDIKTQLTDSDGIVTITITPTFKLKEYGVVWK